MVNIRPGFVAPGQTVDEAYRRWGYKLRRKRTRAQAQAHKASSDKRSSLTWAVKYGILR